jgi:NitT/TauT family transport system permease protein
VTAPSDVTAPRAAAPVRAPVMPIRRLSWIVTANERLFYGIIGFVAVLALWELTADIGLYKKTLLSSPSLMVGAAVEDFGSGAIWPHLAISFEEFAIGLFLALAIGIPLGLAIGIFPRLDAFVSVLLYGIYSTPKAALVPLIIVVTGIGITSKLVVVFLLAIFSVVVTIVAGVHAVSERHLDIARSFGASPWLRFRSVILPSTVPFILAGTRIAAGRALVGVVIAELVSANQGIGYYITFYGTFLDTARVMLGILLLGGFGVVLGEIIRAIEKRFDVWRPALHQS